MQMTFYPKHIYIFMILGPGKSSPCVCFSIWLNAKKSIFRGGTPIFRVTVSKRRHSGIGSALSGEFEIYVVLGICGCWPSKNLQFAFFWPDFMRVERAWVETPGARFLLFMSGPPFYTIPRIFGQFWMSLSNSASKKTSETRFYGLKVRNNAIIVKIVESEVNFGVLQSNDWTNLPTQLNLKTSVIGLSSVKISAQSLQYLSLHLSTTRTTTTTIRWNRHASPKQA